MNKVSVKKSILKRNSVTKMVIALLLLFFICFLIINSNSQSENQGKEITSVSKNDEPIKNEKNQNEDNQENQVQSGQNEKSEEPKSVSDNAKDKSGNTGSSKISVSLQIECKTILGKSYDKNLKIPSNGIIKENITLNLSSGSTVEDALEQSGVDYEANYGYVSEISKLPAGELGEGSAWFYSINGKYPEQPYNAYVLKDGDKLKWRYSITGGSDIDAPGALSVSDIAGMFDSSTLISMDTGDEEGEDEDPAAEDIAGTITNEDDEPLDKIIVTLLEYDENLELWEETASVFSDQDGIYSFSELNSGKYKLRYEDEAEVYFMQYWSGKAILEEADPIFFTSGTPKLDLDITMVKGSVLSGQVTNALSENLSGTAIKLYARENDEWIEQKTVETDDNGRYVFSLLKAGEYTLFFSDLNKKYFSAYWANAATLAEADSIELTLGEEIDTLDIELDKASEISGVISNSDGDIITGAGLKLYEYNPELDSPPLIDEVESDENGFYCFSMLKEGSYLAEVSTCDDKYIPQAYLEKKSLKDADALFLNTGETFTANFTLQKYCILNGTIEDVNGQALSGINICAIGDNSSDSSFTATDAAGSFTFKLFPGSYYIRVNDSTVPGYNSSYSDMYYPDSPYISGAENVTFAVYGGNQTLLIELKDSSAYGNKQVSFHSEYGNVPQPRQVEYGAAIGMLPELSHAGYTFLGWYDAESGGKKIIQSYLVKEDLDLYAYWSENSYITISFNSYGGNPVEPVTRVSGISVGELPVPSYAGMIFKGWYEGILGSGKAVNEESIFISDVTLYAHWERIPNITVSFDPCGGSKIEEQTITKGGKLILLPSPKRAGYEFLGWFLSKEESPEVDKDYIFENSLTLYAHWKKTNESSEKPENNPNITNPDNGSQAEKPGVKTPSKSKVSSLKKIKITNVNKKLKFSKSKLSYSYTMPKGKSKSKITVTKTHKKSKVYIKKAGGKYKQGSSITVKLKKGKRATVYVKVIAENSNYSKIYKLKITRKG